MFVQETASDFYKELLYAVNLNDIQTTYNIYYNVFVRLINQQTTFTNIELVGTFAKTDYLLKEHNADFKLRQSTNDFRVRRLHKNNAGKQAAKDLERYRRHDFKTLCLFIKCILNSEIPDQCQTLFPKETLEKQQRILLDQNEEYKRIIVNRWDDTFIYGTIDSESVSEIMVCYVHGNQYYNYDWTYLKKLLCKGSQLNLIRPRIENNIIYPELIIFEPDYLVDISSIATCFENYATSSVVYLLNKIKATTPTEHTVLGNLAGLLLDEEINHPELSYNENAIEFYRKNALNLIATDFPDNFHQKAKQQKQNIHNAIYNILPATVEKYNIQNVMTEPTFFSEMLGMQGRMDFLQLDNHVIIEQKSGRCGFPQSNPDTPVVNIKHYVQILLYMALLRYNYREQYEKNNRQLHAFLLYSKYKNSLLGIGFAPELLFTALKVRNEITWSEIYYSKGGIKLLETLTPDKINVNKVHNRLWTDYQLPQIEQLLAPIKNATELERTYYIRFLTFIEREHLLSKLGSHTKDHSGFAATWHNTLDEKQQAGNIYVNLTLTYPTKKHKGSVDNVILNFAEQDTNDISNFRKGDIVILYPYVKGTIPDARKTMLFRCTIEDIHIDRIVLRLRAQQSNANVFTRNIKSAWAVEHDFMESSFSSLYHGMHAFLSAPKERKDLLLLQRQPDTDTSKTLIGDYKTFNTLSTKVKQALDLFLIIGPPGTGKTSYGLMTTLCEELQDPNSYILLLAYTNRAVDEICSKLTENGIDFIRIGSPLSCEQAYHPYLLEEKAKTCNNTKALKDMILNARVFAGTTTAFSSHTSILKIRHFTLAIIDEASQILEPHLLGLLSTIHENRPAIRKFVMIGDHKQLPAVVQQNSEESRVTEKSLNSIMLTDCRLSLFERLLRKYRNNPSVTYTLIHQGRMHHDIAEFPNQNFYEGTLQEVPLPHQLRPIETISTLKSDDRTFSAILDTCRLAFIDVPTPEQSPSDKVNSSEAEIIAELVIDIYRRTPNFNASTTLGIIVPYRNQIATIRNYISNYDIPELNAITIDTVERYQGNQRDYIIYGFTIQKYYQISFLTDNTFEENGYIIDRKLNVVMTRARESLILVGNASLLQRNVVFSKLIKYINDKSCLFNTQCQTIPKY